VVNVWRPAHDSRRAQAAGGLPVLGTQKHTRARAHTRTRLHTPPCARTDTHAHACTHWSCAVYIYGGSNDFGEAEPYNASQLAVNHATVVVSFNYRTGPLGFAPFVRPTRHMRGTLRLSGLLSSTSCRVGWLHRPRLRPPATSRCST
jgi:hypothetical protein